MRAMVWIGLALLACGGEPAGPREAKTVPNETPPQALEPAPVEELSSTAEILQQIRRQMAARQAADARLPDPRSEPDPQAQAKPEPDLPDSPDPPDPPAEANPQATRAFVDRFFPLPPTPRAESRGPTDLNGFVIGPPRPDLGASPGAAPAAKSKPKTQPKPPGGRLFPPRARTADPGRAERVERLVPPGRFFRARLLGNLAVSLVSPAAMATIYDPADRPIGLAVGAATLHRGSRDRALLTFHELHLDDGRSLKGNLAAFDLDFSQGLRGRRERRGFQQFFQALWRALFAALSLEVETGDGFADVFKFNLAGKLLDQAGRELNQADLTRRVHLARGTLFWVTSLQELSLRENAYAEAIGAITTHARDAFQGALQTAPVDAARRQALSAAYDRLQDRLHAFAPESDPPDPFR